MHVLKTPIIKYVKQQKILRKHWTACSLCRSLLISFLRRGCLIGWFECRHSNSSCRRRTVIFVSVRFGVGLLNAHIHTVFCSVWLWQWSIVISAIHNIYIFASCSYNVHPWGYLRYWESVKDANMDMYSVSPKKTPPTFLAVTWTNIFWFQ